MSKFEIIVENGVVTNKSIASQIVKAVDAGKHIGIDCMYTSKGISKIIIVTDDSPINKKAGIIKQGHCFLGEISHNDALEMKLDIEDGSVPKLVTKELNRYLKSTNAKGEKEMVKGEDKDIKKSKDEKNNKELSIIADDTVTVNEVEEDKNVDVQVQETENDAVEENKESTKTVYGDMLDKTVLDRIKHLQANPIYSAPKDVDGRYILIEKNGMKIKCYGAVGGSDYCSSVYIYPEKNGVAGISKVVSINEISNMSAKIFKYIGNNKARFALSEINLAVNRLWLLNEIKKIEEEDLDCYMNPSEILGYFKEYISEHITDYVIVNNNKIWGTVYAEQMDDGHYDIGIWQEDFKVLYKELETDVTIKEWCKMGKGMKWLLPDTGRGGGQHTPGSGRCNDYGKDKKDRIQRFVFTEEEAQELWGKKMLVNMINVSVA